MDLLYDLVDYGVMGLLCFLCFLALAYYIERRLFYRDIKTEAYSSREELKFDLGKNLSIIGTIAGNSPYVGLLGTVFGIMLSFFNIGQDSNIDTGKIMVDLSLALKATAAGLAVAIVSVVLYNSAISRAKKMLMLWDKSNGR